MVFTTFRHSPALQVEKRGKNRNLQINPEIKKNTGLFIFIQNILIKFKGWKQIGFQNMDTLVDYVPFSQKRA